MVLTVLMVQSGYDVMSLATIIYNDVYFRRDNTNIMSTSLLRKM